MQFLADMGVEMGHYNHRYEGEWGALSPPRELDDGHDVWCDNIAYYIEGTELAATVLKIKLYINATSDRTEAEDIFVLYAMHLLEQAVGFEAAERLKMQIALLKDFQADIPFDRCRWRVTTSSAARSRMGTRAFFTAKCGS